MKRVTWQELRDVSRLLGCVESRIKGDHLIMTRAGDIIRSNMKTLGINRAEFERQLDIVRKRRERCGPCPQYFLYTRRFQSDPERVLIEVKPMKPEIHPKYQQVQAHCACGETWTTGSTKKELRVEICSKCHPYFTGKQKLLDTAGRIDRFQQRFAKKAGPKEAAAK